MPILDFKVEFRTFDEMIDSTGILLCKQNISTHAEVGGYLLGLWGLPIPVVEAIAWHHSPSRLVKQSFSPLTATHLANSIASEALFASSGLRTNGVDADYVRRLGLTEQFQVWRHRLNSGRFRVEQ